MKALKLSLCFFLIFLLCACSKGEFCDLSGLINSYNEVSEDKISMTDFIFTDNGSYMAFIGEDNNVTLIQVKEDKNKKIKSINVIIPKVFGALPDKSDIDAFREILTNTLMAFCSYEKETVNEIITAFGLNDDKAFTKKGELTLKKANYYFVFYSDEVTSQMMISNTYLHKIEETSKPASRPYYGENFIEKD